MEALWVMEDILDIQVILVMAWDMGVMAWDMVAMAWDMVAMARDMVAILSTIIMDSIMDIIRCTTTGSVVNVKMDLTLERCLQGFKLS